MTLHDLVEWVEWRAPSTSESEQPDPDWLDLPDDLEQLWIVLGRAESIQRASRELTDHVRSVMAARLDGRIARLGNTIYQVRPDMVEHLSDPDGLVEWLGDDWRHVIPVTPSTRVRRQALRAVAERRGLDPQTVWDTFIDVEPGEPRLQAVPVAKAAQWMQRLEHGEVLDRRSRG